MAGKKIIETLVTELTADGAKLKKEMDDSLRHAKSWGDKVTSIAKGVGAGLVAGGTALAASAAVLTKAAIDNADALFEQSQKLGISTESLSAYQYAASMSGLSTDKFNGYLNKLNRTLVDAYKGTGKGVDAFELLGVEVKDSEGKMRSNTDVLIDLMDAFSRLPDTAGKAALAQDIFGKSGAEMLPFLNNGIQGLSDLTDEAERFNLVVDSKTAETANKFNDELDKIGKAADGIGNKLAAEVLPSLLKLAEFVTDQNTQDGLGIIAEGLLEIAAAGYKFIGTITGIAPATEALATLLTTADRLKPSELAEKQKELNELIGRARIAYGDEYWKDQAFQRDTASKDIQRLKAEIKTLREKPQKDFEAELDADGYEKAFEAYDDPKTAEDLIKGGVDKKNDPTKNWEIEQKREIALMMEKENKAREIADREVLMQRDKFMRIHEEQLISVGNDTAVEKLRFERAKADLKDEMDFMREKGLLSMELELEFQKAKENMELTHQERLNKIRQDADDVERKKKEEGYGHLIDLAESYNDAKGRSANRYTAVALNAMRILSSKEKREQVGSVLRDGVKAVQKAWASGPFPLNVPAVTLATGAAAANFAAVSGIAHGGLNNVPKESTYLLAAGERVVSPKQNRDLTQYLEQNKSGGASAVVNVHNYSGQPVDVKTTGDVTEVIIGKVMDKLTDQVARGNGIASVFQNTYGLKRRAM